MSAAALVYPHQLFADHPAVSVAATVVLVEEPLFFTQYRFHRQKLMLHRASMRWYADFLKQQGKLVHYLSAQEVGTTERLPELLVALGISAVLLIDPTDDWLWTRLQAGLAHAGIGCELLPDPAFLTPQVEIDRYAEQKKRLFFNDFYVSQRKRLGVLVDARQKPIGGAWSFDAANRKRLPKGISIPTTYQPASNKYRKEAQTYVRAQFPDALGDDLECLYPISHAEAQAALDHFLTHRFAQFGPYEDAICEREPFLFHSVLTPPLNIGLLTPSQILASALDATDGVELNSVEGFVRQLIGWREYMRMVYLKFGRVQRSRNFWEFDHSIPGSLYRGTTGIVPVDTVIQRLRQYGYCHHIERLMVLGNFMLLCRIAPDAVYQWFMEYFVDSYDWVMVPNVYGMSQYSDGGLITTKPYLSGSNYLLKMSDFKRGPWCEIWDALYWAFIADHREVFAGNHRMSVMIGMLDKLGEKLTTHRAVAERFLNELHR